MRSKPRATRRISQGSSPPCERSSSEASAGTTVKAMSTEAPSASTMVSATGANSLPSSPCSVSSGRNTMAMMDTPASMGTETAETAWRISTARSCGGELPAVSMAVAPADSFASAVSMFSTTTTAASTSMPRAMARPPRLIRLAVRPAWRISRKVASMDSGSVAATTRAARSPPRNR